MNNLVFVVPFLFFLISFFFSMLGMGGSQLYIPVLYWLGLDFKTQAIPLGILLNLVSSISAAWVYGRKKMVEWKVVLFFGGSMILFAPLGTFFSLKLSPRPIILVFAIFTALAAILMLSGWKPKKGKLGLKAKIILGIVAGGLLGFLAGMIGRGGGSFIVPLLYLIGLEPKIAAATSSVIVSCAGLSNFLSHLAVISNPPWMLWGFSLLAVIAGSQLGSRTMVAKINSKQFKKIFAIVLLSISAILLFQIFK